MSHLSRRRRTAGGELGDNDETAATDRWLARVVLLACALLVIAGFGGSLVGATVFGSTDTLYQFAPWAAQAAPGFTPANDYVGDPVDAVFPPMVEVVGRLHHGDLPAWTSLQLGGSELGAPPNLALLSPTTAPYLLLPTWLAPAYVKLLEIGIALGGMFLYGRRIGLGRAASWFGGLAFITCGFLTAWTNWQQTRTAAFIPALFWALERLVQERTARAAALLALSVAALLAGGFPSVTAYALFTAAPYVLVRSVAIGWRRDGAFRRIVTSLGLAAAGVAVGVALLAVQLLPFVRQLGAVDLAARTQTPDESLNAVSLTTALVPDGLGTPVSHLAWLGPRNPIESFSYVGVGVALVAAIGLLRLRSAVSTGSGGLGEVPTPVAPSSAGLGEVPTPVSLSAAGLGEVPTAVSPSAAGVREVPTPVSAAAVPAAVPPTSSAASSSGGVRRAGAALGVRTFLLVAIVVWGLAVYRGGQVLEVIQHLPTMDINPIARARSVLGFFTAALAAIGVDALVRARAQTRTPAHTGTAAQPRARGQTRSASATVATGLRWLAWAALAVAVARLVGAGARFADEEGFESSYLQATAVAGGVLVVAMVSAVLAARATGRAGAIGLTLLPLVVLVPAAVVVQPWWPESPRASFYPETPTHDFLAAHLGSDRFLSTDDAMVPGSNLAYGLRSLDGHAFIRPEFADLLREIDPDGFVAPTLWHPHLSAATSAASAPLLDRLAVKYLVAPPDAPVVGAQRIVGGGGGMVGWRPGTTLTLDLDGPAVRGVGVVLADDPGALEATITVRLLDAVDAVVGVTSRRLTRGDTEGPVTAAVVAPADAVRAELTLASPTPLALVGDAQPQLVRVDARDDGLEIAHAGDTTIYERSAALPRIRWAVTERPGTDTSYVVDLLRSGDAPDVIVDALGRGDTEGSAGLTLQEDSGDTVRVSVDADGAGYLVVADAMQGTFRATLDGEPTPLTTADHGYVAVAVPDGSHAVELSYRSPAGHLGAVVSAFSAVLLLGALVWRPRKRR